jgi:uncharacterized protein (TIGR00369 family)
MKAGVSILKPDGLCNESRDRGGRGAQSVVSAIFAEDGPMQRIRASFDRQGYMRTLGAMLESVEPGTVTITCGFGDGLTQQHGLWHGGVVASLVDVACGYAALSMMPADREVLTVEFKVHFLKPATTGRLIAVGQVVQAGRTLTVCEGSAFAATRTRVLAKMTATMMAVVADPS